MSLVGAEHPISAPASLATTIGSCTVAFEEPPTNAKAVPPWTAPLCLAAAEPFALPSDVTGLRMARSVPLTGYSRRWLTDQNRTFPSLDTDESR